MRANPFATLLLSVFVALALCSCSTDSDYETTTSGDCIVTAMTLGTLNRYLVTKDAAGQDSTYRVTVTGSLYPLSIDHLNARIFNRDSLPYGTDISKVVFNAVNTTGILLIRSLHTAKDSAFVASDSTDFTLPRLLTAYASDGVSRRSYEMTLRVHREEGDSMRWNVVCSNFAPLTGLTEVRTLAFAGGFHVFGYRGGELHHVSIPYTPQGVADETQWTDRAIAVGLRTQSIVVKDNCCLAIADDGCLLTTADGWNWTQVETDFRPSALLAGGKSGWAAICNQAFWTSVDGREWTQVENDEPTAVLVGDVASVCQPATGKYDREIHVAVGMKEGKPVVWRRAVDLQGEEVYPWVNIPAVETSPYNCPLLPQPSLFAYDGATCMAGWTAEGQWSPVYCSHDNGRTWLPDEWKLPESSAGPVRPMAVASDEYDFVWWLDTSNGKLWRGRHNRLGWK